MRIFTLVLIGCIIIAAPSWAGIGITASSNPEALTMSSTSLTGTSFSGFSVAGEGAVGTVSGPNYNLFYGLAGTIYSSDLPGMDAAKPQILNILFDGHSLSSGDYVNPNVVITATITDESGIDAVNSYISIDGAIASFSSLSGASTFDGQTGAISYVSDLTVGSHTVLVKAVDNATNYSTSDTLSVVVADGELKIVGNVNNYPNPFSPPAQTTKICYMLNGDTDAKIYIFNIVGQLVKKFTIQSGQDGGHSGYNEVLWDGISDFSEVLPNDVYICKIVVSGKVIGKCKIAILK